MTRQEAEGFLNRVFLELFDPAVPASEVGRFFAPEYIQHSDGKELDHAAFVAHAQVLKDALTEGSVRFKKLVVDGPVVASHHVVEARKKTGEEVEAEVLAFFEIEDGLIRRTDELTHLLRGSAGDRDLGSRTSAQANR